MIKACRVPALAIMVLMAIGKPVLAQTVAPPDQFPAQVGDIAFDPAIDDPSFRVCDSQQVYQYYMMSSYYRRHKRAIADYFISRYKAATNGTGYLTIRFIINCSGSAGRFRVYQLDSNYNNCRFGEDISGPLMNLVRSYKGWEPASSQGKNYDSYQYITFKLKKGAIESISP